MCERRSAGHRSARGGVCRELAFPRYALENLGDGLYSIELFAALVRHELHDLVGSRESHHAHMRALLFDGLPDLEFMAGHDLPVRRVPMRPRAPRARLRQAAAKR